MNKVYCINCRYLFNLSKLDSVEEDRCTHAANSKQEDTPLKPIRIDGLIKDCNRNNNCKLFEEKRNKESL